MSERISIREAARRLGVSDTAVRKAITAGRVKVAGHTDTSNRPLLAWPDCQRDWGANSDSSKRTHFGSQGSPRREKYAPQSASQNGGPPSVADDQAQFTDDGSEMVIHDGMTLTEAKTAQAIYAARQARLDYETSIGKLIEADQVKAKAFRMARGARDALLTLPDRLAPVLASETDVQAVHRLLLEDIERTCQRIAMDAQKAA